MTRVHRIAPAMLGVLAITIGVSGCVTRVVERPGPERTVYVQAPPPEAIVEVQPPPPGPPELWVWKRGYYRWERGQYIWHVGLWEPRPRRDAVWEQPHWERGPGGWVLIEGHFR